MLSEEKTKRYIQLRNKWNQILPGITLEDVEQIMGFRFNLDSQNDKGRMVYSHHTEDYLPFYLVIDKESGKVIRKHNIRALDEA